MQHMHVLHMLFLIIRELFAMQFCSGDKIYSVLKRLEFFYVGTSFFKNG